MSASRSADADPTSGGRTLSTPAQSRRAALRQRQAHDEKRHGHCCSHRAAASAAYRRFSRRMRMTSPCLGSPIGNAASRLRCSGGRGARCCPHHLVRSQIGHLRHQLQRNVDWLASAPPCGPEVMPLRRGPAAGWVRPPTDLPALVENAEGHEALPRGNGRQPTGEWHAPAPPRGGWR
jgi:hypothetical protein